MQSTEVKDEPKAGIASKLRSKKKFAILISVIVIVISVSIGSYIFTSTKSNQILPYDIKWGATYEEVVEKDRSAMQLTKNDSGGYNSLGVLSENYFDDFDNYDSLSCGTMYTFGKDKALKEITIMVAIEEESNLNSDEFFSYLLSYYNKKCNVEPTKSVSEYTWDIKGVKVDVAYLMDNFFMITFKSTK